MKSISQQFKESVEFRMVKFASGWGADIEAQQSIKELFLSIATNEIQRLEEVIKYHTPIIDKENEAFITALEEQLSYWTSERELIKQDK